MADTFSPDVINSVNARLDKLTPNSKAVWGRMSVTQMLAHLNDALRIALGMKNAKNKANIFTNKVMFNVAVYVLPTWPKGSATAPEMAQEKEGTRPRDFYTEIEFLKKMLDVFNEREPAKIQPHPMFGKLTKAQWRDLFVKHVDHHLRQFGV